MKPRSPTILPFWLSKYWPASAMHILVLASFALVSLPSETARADAIGVLVRGVGAGSDKAAGFVAHFLAQALDEREQLDVINLSKRLGNPNDDRAAKALASAEDLFAKGHAAYETLDLDAAVDHLNNALTRIERHAGYTTDFSRVAEILMLLGATHILRGEEKTGRKRLSQAIALYPEVVPDPRVFNPGMRAVFDEQARELELRPRGTLSVTSNPSYARVFLDGVFVGVTPLAVDDVVEGRHFVRLVKEGYREWGRVIEVAGRVESADVARLEPTSSFEELDALVEASMPALPRKAAGDEVGEVFRQLGVVLDVQQLAMAEVRLDGDRVRVFAAIIDLAGNRAREVATQTFSYDSRPKAYEREVDELVVKLLDEHPVEEDSLAADIPTVGAAASCYGMSCSKLKVLLLAVGGGGGVILGSLGAVLDYLAYVDHKEFLETAQTDSRATDLRRAGTTKAIVGDALIGVGAAVAITSAVLFFLWEPAPSAEEVIEQPGSHWNASLVPTSDGVRVTFGARF